MAFLTFFLIYLVHTTDRRSLTAFGKMSVNRNDITQAAELLKDHRDTVVLADKGYDSQSLIDTLASQGCIGAIPSK